MPLLHKAEKRCTQTMKKNLILIVVLCLFIFSCKDKKTYYYYQGVTVTRIDGDVVSAFCYGRINDDTTGHPFVKAEYPGLHTGLDAAIQFKEDSVVEIIHLGGEYLTPSDVKESRISIG